MNNLQQQELENIKEESTTFTVKDLESANWCLRKIQALENRIAENKALADSEKERIGAWEEEVTKTDKNNIEFFEGLLKSYFVEQRAIDKKFKISTPYGKVTTRKTNKWFYDDEKVKTWLKENGHTELLKVKEELDKTNIKKLFKDGIDQETGELVDGVTIEEIESISVKVD